MHDIVKFNRKQNINMSQYPDLNITLDETSVGDLIEFNEIEGRQFGIILSANKLADTINILLLPNGTVRTFYWISERWVTVLARL